MSGNKIFKFRYSPGVMAIRDYGIDFDLFRQDVSMGRNYLRNVVESIRRLEDMAEFEGMHIAGHFLDPKKQVIEVMYKANCPDHYDGIENIIRRKGIADNIKTINHTKYFKSIIMQPFKNDDFLISMSVYNSKKASG